jgi:hypothetical protein
LFCEPSYGRLGFGLIVCSNFEYFFAIAMRTSHSFTNGLAIFRVAMAGDPTMQIFLTGEMDLCPAPYLWVPLATM